VDSGFKPTDFGQYFSWRQSIDGRNIRSLPVFSWFRNTYLNILDPFCRRNWTSSDAFQNDSLWRVLYSIDYNWSETSEWVYSWIDILFLWSPPIVEASPVPPTVKPKAAENVLSDVPSDGTLQNKVFRFFAALYRFELCTSTSSTSSHFHSSQKAWQNWPMCRLTVHSLYKMTHPGVYSVPSFYADIIARFSTPKV